MCLKVKRKRSTNFIDSELELLVNLVHKNKHILENKKTDAVMANLKNKTWDTLSKTFNSKCLNGYRNERCLKLKYENLKKIVKIKFREVKTTPCVTGGGPPIPQKSIGKLTGLEEKVRSLYPLAFDGNVSHFDNDCAREENIQLIDEIIVQDYEIKEHNDLVNEVLQTCDENRSRENELKLMILNAELASKLNE